MERETFLSSFGSDLRIAFESGSSSFLAILRDERSGARRLLDSSLAVDASESGVPCTSFSTSFSSSILRAARVAGD